MTRQEANKEIYKLISSMFKYFDEELLEIPHQRFGQILCNYVYPDYRDVKYPIMKYLFPGNPDPFFEESEVTLKRLHERLSSIT